MTEPLLMILHMGMLAIEFSVYIILSSSFFQISLRISRVIAICSIAYLINFGVLMCLGNHVSLKLFLGCVLFAVLSKVLYSASYIHSIFLSILFLALINVGDSILLFLLSAVSRQSFSSIMADPFSYYLQAYTVKTIELLISSFIHAWGTQRFYKRSPSLPNYFKFTLFPILSLVCTVTLFSTCAVYPKAAPQLLFCTITLLVSNIINIVLLNQFEAQQQAVINNQFLQPELKLARDTMDTLSSAYSKERKLTHDFQNKLAVIQGLLQQDHADAETRQYVNELINQEYTPALAMSTRRTVVDVLLNQKYSTAQEKGISFRVQLDDLSHFPLPDDAFVVVLSNLIDNALEACEKIKDPSQRYILIKAKVDREENILYIENSVDAPVKISNGTIPTSKKDSLSHGYGLQNVISIIKSYGGLYAIRCENHAFAFVVSFDMKQAT